MKPGVVALVGAGPGDPGLITVRGRELLQRADVIVYDRLAHPFLLSYARPEAEKVYVGKASAHHAMRQEEINQLLVERALKGLQVVRLKGGDPLVFGRGGEEAQACREAGVFFEIVPGVTSAIAAPAYAGIAVTHRDAASSFVVITGHERDDASAAGARTAGRAEGRRNWATLAHAADTLVFLMGVEALPEITARLQEHGRSPDTPVALVQWGTWPRQRTVTGTLATIQNEMKRAGITPPAVCVVGEVVKLREELRWFDTPAQRPLLGKRIAVTRAREQASSFAAALQELGAETLLFPVIRIEPIEQNQQLREALLLLPQTAWVVFTSVNAVEPVARQLHSLGWDARAFHNVRIAAIGPATAEAVLKGLGLRADFMPDEAVAEAMAAQWPEEDLRGKHVLLPRAAEARDVLPDALKAKGAMVNVVNAYRTVNEEEASAEFMAALQQGSIDAITFTASSTVHNFVRSVAGADTARLASLLQNIVLAAIGPVTAAALQQYGLQPAVVAPVHTIPGLLEALLQHYAPSASA